MGEAEANFRWAATLVGALAAGGARHAVISPGSRSTPLVLACRATAGLKLWTVIDERSAAFFALGLARQAGTPVLVIGTSGGAPAHWHPAVIEASQTGVPLILLSADRPPESQDCAANQTVDQPHLFGRHARAFHALPPPDASLPALPGIAARALDQARWPDPGPVHLNIPFREPLVPESLEPPSLPPVPRTEYPPPAPPELADLARKIGGRPGLMVWGGSPATPEAAKAAADLAKALDVPLLADPLSGLRAGSHDRTAVLTHHDAWLRGCAPQAEWVLSLGGPPVSRFLNRHLETADFAEFVVVDPRGRWPDPWRKATRMLRADPGEVCKALRGAAPGGNLAEWRAAEKAARDLIAFHSPLEAEIVAALMEQVPDDAVLFSGNSMAIRELDAFSGTRAGPLRIVANRGASGIDGNVSTLLGMAAAGARVVGLLGDLALAHDLNGLLLARNPGLEATIVVLNNGGGGIFEYLPQAGLPGFAEHWLTPTGLDMERIAQLFGLPFRRVATGAEFGPALREALQGGGVRLLEVAIDRETSVARHRAYWRAVAQGAAG